MKRLIQILFSMALSFVILNIVCFFYYNVPVHSESQTGSTDYVWEKGKFYSKGTEGFAWGKTDENGFNNISAEYASNPDILVMGSSHTEAFNVAQSESYTYILNGLMEKSDVNMSAYNIGVSGHNTVICLSNFENALEEFKPNKYVVIEVSSTELSEDDIRNISNGTVSEIHSSANPILVFLQKIPFIRCVYYQLDKMGLFDEKKDTDNNDQNQIVAVEQETSNSDSSIANDPYSIELNELFKHISFVAEQNGVKLIIIYNDTLVVDDKGEVIPQGNTKESRAFEYACKNNGIGFLNMHEAYAKMYNESHNLPHGFSNTEVGKGHLNKFGHEVVAKELHSLIMSLEKQNTVMA